MSRKENKNREGISLENKQAHSCDHETHTRRSFLHTLGMGGAASFMLGSIPLNIMGASPLQASLSMIEADRVLILVRLKGGNDGLNTFIPLTDYGTYTAARPSIAIPQSEILNLSSEIGIPNYMSSALNLWNDGKMKIVQGVGYEDQNLSHFTSSDVWASAKNPEDYPYSTGWMGRFFDNEYPDYLLNPPAVPPAIQIGARNSLMFQSANTNMGMSVVNPTELYEIAQTGSLYDAEAVPECYYGEQLAFTRTVANTTFLYADIIKEAFEGATNDVDYNIPEMNFDPGFANQLAVVARLIKGNLGTNIYMVEIDGFDTHEGQANEHPQLLQEVSKGMELLFQDLETTGHDTKTLAMTISEFGRRVEENGSLGTDHGASAPMMLFSGALTENGIIGENVDFSSANSAGNIPYQTDFRSVYATVLENWLCVDPSLVDSVLLESYQRIDGLTPDCISTGYNYTESYKLMHQARYGQSEIAIYYQLPTAGSVTVELYDINGRKLFDIYKGNDTAGSYQKSFNPKAKQLPLGNYVYRITFKNRPYSGKVSIFGT